MVALLSQCFNEKTINQPPPLNPDDATINKPGNQKNIEDSKTYPFPPQREYPDLPKPANSQLLKKDDSIIKLQFNELNNYIEYLEKIVEDYKKSIEERDKKVFNEKYHVIENFELGGKNTNDLLVYIMTAVFILLLVDYIFKMGKNSY
tara:strand:- start:59 stop:502 length:444 start_codon:yes stop_codon:yes gene_type:complete